MLELDRPSSKGLDRAAKVVKLVHSDLARTTEITYADVVAFAGAAAIEAVGGQKVTVQLGRDNAKKAEPEGAREGFDWEAPTLAGWKQLGEWLRPGPGRWVRVKGTVGLRCAEGARRVRGGCVVRRKVCARRKGWCTASGWRPEGRQCEGHGCISPEPASVERQVSRLH